MQAVRVIKQEPKPVNNSFASVDANNARRTLEYHLERIDLDTAVNIENILETLHLAYSAKVLALKHKKT